ALQRHSPAPSQAKPGSQGGAGTCWPPLHTCGRSPAQERSPSTQSPQVLPVEELHSAAEAQVSELSSPSWQVRSTVPPLPPQRAAATSAVPVALQVKSASPLQLSCPGTQAHCPAPAHESPAPHGVGGPNV